MSLRCLTKIFPINKARYYGEFNEKIAIYYKSKLILRLHSEYIDYEIVDGQEPTFKMNEQRSVLQEIFDISLKPVRFHPWNKKTRDVMNKLIRSKKKM